MLTQEPLAHILACALPVLQSTLSSFMCWFTSLNAVHAPQLAALPAPALHMRVQHELLTNDMMETADP